VRSGAFLLRSCGTGRRRYGSSARCAGFLPERGAGSVRARYHSGQDPGDPPHPLQIRLPSQQRSEAVNSDTPVEQISPAPPQLIPKSMATAGLLAHIVVSKFEDGYVQTAGFNGLDHKSGIVMVTCWVHTRRKFYEVLHAAAPRSPNVSWPPNRRWSSSANSTESKKVTTSRAYHTGAMTIAPAAGHSSRPNRCWRNSNAGWTKRRR
jgi:hypothetical protein